MGRRVREIMERIMSFVRDSKECGERDERELSDMNVDEMDDEYGLERMRETR